MKVSIISQMVTNHSNFGLFNVKMDEENENSSFLLNNSNIKTDNNQERFLKQF
jgi:hypothetical protein